jgi:hypothetical protein
VVNIDLEKRSQSYDHELQRNKYPTYVGSAFEKTKKISSTLKNALAYKIQKA